MPQAEANFAGENPPPWPGQRIISAQSWSPRTFVQLQAASPHLKQAGATIHDEASGCTM